ncbi:ABC transporter permease [Gracilimonas sp.]|uniref:ABC transporter permease n=1 Tax=Gracilimonas sp. TaxID=1974203 RepID=UPI0028726833|nr:ABC transporter permease [Gracilimonas sp.]
MLKNYLKITFRNLKKDKGYTFINLTGLSVGLAICLIIALFIQFHLGFDQFHEKSDRIYRIAKEESHSGEPQRSGNMQGPLAGTLADEIPEVQQAVRLQSVGKTLVTVDGESFYEENIMRTDPSFFKIFDIVQLQQNKEDLLSDKSSIVLTEQIAHKYFGDRDPLGQIITLNETDEYTVTGIVQNLPAQSHVHFSMLINLPDELYGVNIMDWNRLSAFYTYLLLDENADPDQVLAKVPQVLEGKISDGALANTSYFLQPLKDIHLKSDLSSELSSDRIMSINYIYLFATIGFFILLIASLNYINLSTARATTRLKEVGVRKTAGAGRNNLFWQFTGEILLLTFFAALLSLGVAELLLNQVNALMKLELSTAALWSPGFLGGFLLVVFLTGFLSGVYPSLMLSSFKPSEVLKGSQKVFSGGGLRKGLIVFQFTVSMVLVIGTLIIDRQMSYIQNKNLGLNPDQVLNIALETNSSQSSAQSFIDELNQIPGIESYTASAGIPAHGGTRLYLFFNEDDEEPTPVYYNRVDQDFIETMGMTLVSGRNFTPSDFEQARTKALVNRSLIDQQGWTPEEAIGQKIDSYEVIGVLQDYHFQSLENEIEPALITTLSGDPYFISARLSSNNLSSTMGQIEETWQQINPAAPMQYSFLDDTFESLYRSEQQLGILFSSFALITIIIACMGLFGLMAFMASKRAKEIGIRKVLGASIANIVALLSKDFVKLVILGFVIASPIAWYAMNQWLADFAYRIEIGPGIFALAGIAALVIALLTVSWQSIKAALANPVDSLRSE